MIIAINKMLNIKSILALIGELPTTASPVLEADKLAAALTMLFSFGIFFTTGSGLEVFICFVPTETATGKTAVEFVICCINGSIYEVPGAPVPVELIAIF